jgi:dolichyl-phosphate beta-glucosyltransferase
LPVCRPILEAAHIDGFGFDVELLYLAQQAHLRIREIPVHWDHYEGSKVRLLPDSLRMLRELFVLRTAATGDGQHHAVTAKS